MMFDFGKIKEVNSIVLRPNEVVVFHIPDLTDAERAEFNEWIEDTPLKNGKVLVISHPDVGITKVTVADEEE